MYKAASEGDWAAAKKILRRHESVVWSRISQYGESALHVAVKAKHAEFVCELIRWMEPKCVEIKDCYGYTACCYAAMDGNVELVRILMEANPSVWTCKTRKARKEMEDSFDHLAKRLWSEVLAAGGESALELVKQKLSGWYRPSVLHVAARAGNLKLINMITDDFPRLLSYIDDRTGCSVLHTIVMHRQDKNITEFLKKAKGVEDDGFISLDEGGNNILHAAAKSIYPKGLDIVAEQDFEMQKAFAFFKQVEEFGHADFGKMRNNEGCRPIDLFWKEHATMLSTSETYLKRTSESCMLISTIVLTLVFAAAFAPPGGLNQETGIPILLKKKWFTSFIVFEILALSTSTFSIIGFWSIIISKTKEYQFFVWPRNLRLSMCALLLSVLFVISALLSALLLVFVRERRVLAMSFILPLYMSLFIVIFYQVLKVLQKTNRHSLMDASSSKRSTLWRRVYDFGASMFSFSGPRF